MTKKRKVGGSPSRALGKARTSGRTETRNRLHGEWKKSIAKVIDKMVARIVKRFHPDQIILFGSYARGDAGPDSDVDLLVVMPVEKDLRRRKQLELRLALHDFRVAKDIIITTPEDFAWRKEIPGTIERPASLEGKVVYVRP